MSLFDDPRVTHGDHAKHAAKLRDASIACDLADIDYALTALRGLPPHFNNVFLSVEWRDESREWWAMIERRPRPASGDKDPRHMHGDWLALGRGATVAEAIAALARRVRENRRRAEESAP